MRPRVFWRKLTFISRLFSVISHLPKIPRVGYRFTLSCSSHVWVSFHLVVFRGCTYDVWQFHHDGADGLRHDPHRSGRRLLGQDGETASHRGDHTLAAERPGENCCTDLQWMKFRRAVCAAEGSAKPLASWNRDPCRKLPANCDAAGYSLLHLHGSVGCRPRSIWRAGRS